MQPYRSSSFPRSLSLWLFAVLLSVSAYGAAEVPKVSFYFYSYVNGALKVNLGPSPNADCRDLINYLASTGTAVHDGRYYGPMVDGVDTLTPGMTGFFCSATNDVDGRSSQTGTGYAVCGPNPYVVNTSAFVDSTTWTCVCRAGEVFMDDVQRCVAAEPVVQDTDPGRSVGPTCDLTCGQPIHPGTGNMWHIEPDYRSPAAGGLSLVRTYNSLPEALDAAVPRTFGVRWTSAYDAVLSAEARVPDGAQPGKCVRRADTGTVWCARPAAPATAIPDAVSILRGDGKRYYFNRVDRTYVSTWGGTDRVQASYAADGSISGWVYTSADGDIKERYGVNGLLLSITARNGTVQRLTYSDGVHANTALGRLPADAPACANVPAGAAPPSGKLMCVTDHYGRQLQFEYDAKGRVAALVDPAGGRTTYEYDGPSGGCNAPSAIPSPACTANNLTRVTYPDGKSRVYFYNEREQIASGQCPVYVPGIAQGYGHLFNALTGLQDENGARHISWTYDCDGKATSSELDGGVERVELAYASAASATPVTTVTHTVGDPASPQTTTTAYAYQRVNGVLRSVGTDKPCVECGVIAGRTFDANGNVATTTDWNGRVTRFTYDLVRNLETSRTEAAGTPVERKITTEWHPAFRLPARVAEPKRIVTYGRNDAGDVLTRTEQATTDATGKAGMQAVADGPPRVWRYTYYPDGQIKTVTGPRTDVADVTTYTYDATGNLETVKNALGRVTRYSNYDAHGRAGRIDAPNGTYTTFEYVARGWLHVQTTHAGQASLQTVFDHDGVGQIKRVTLPDGTFTDYAYDDAHRLTRVSDGLGNSVVYTLDLTGNRIREQVNDPASALARQISRVYDVTGKLKSETGAAR